MLAGLIKIQGGAHCFNLFVYKTLPVQESPGTCGPGKLTDHSSPALPVVMSYPWLWWLAHGSAFAFPGVKVRLAFASLRVKVASQWKQQTPQVLYSDYMWGHATKACAPQSLSRQDDCRKHNVWESQQTILSSAAFSNLQKHQAKSIQCSEFSRVPWIEPLKHFKA